MTESHRPAIGLCGFEEHPWASLNRTRAFYLRALAEEFETTLVEDVVAAAASGRFAALVNFFGRDCWDLPQHPDCPLLLALHGGPVLDQEFLRSRLERLETSDALIVNCTSDLAIFDDLFVGAGPHLCHLPLPVDPARFHPLPRDQCLESVPIVEADIVIGFVGRLLPQKGLHYCLRFIAELQRRLHPRTVSGLVIGDYWGDYPVLDYVTSDYPQGIASLIQELDLSDAIAYFPADMNDQELSACYSLMDLLIHPTCSLDENFGYTPVEAMACGTPVVGASYGGLKDTIADGITGIAMPTWTTRTGIRMDSLAAVEKAEAWLRDETALKQLSSQSVQRARQVYSEQVCGRALCDGVREAIRLRSTGLAKSGSSKTGPSKPGPPKPGSSKTGPSETIRLRREAPAEPPSGLLPPIDTPWEFYRPVVEHYVSGPLPSLHDTTRVWMPAPLKPLGQGRYQVQDPAWPAVHELTAADLELLEYCHSPQTVAHLELAAGPCRQTLQQWLELGLVSASSPGKRKP
ncbi:MAG: glycosyltransferase [Deltaproteobacteria bacterium]|nr:glycosyltransferase [Deltaproteobacteria bacterium]